MDAGKSDGTDSVCRWRRVAPLTTPRIASNILIKLLLFAANVNIASLSLCSLRFPPLIYFVYESFLRMPLSSLWRRGRAAVVVGAVVIVVVTVIVDLSTFPQTIIARPSELFCHFQEYFNVMPFYRFECNSLCQYAIVSAFKLAQH